MQQTLLTDSVGHAVKEDPPVLCSCEADIVAGLDTDHREQLQLINITCFWRWGNLLNTVIASALGWVD